jgi:AcrR family transcriptional regulator
MRADARRNRERLLAAADLVFAEQGPAASTEEVARRAGVGIGTVFRHFPSKESLLEAVFVGRLRRLADEADKLSRAEEAGSAFFALLHTVVEQSDRKRAFADALSAAGVDVAAASAAAKHDLHRASEKLLARAQAAGAVRPDIGTDVLLAVVVGLARAANCTADRAVRARALEVLMDGLRPR